eukprot:TRINITY_DN11730_c0_g1_i8.p2 TRINITY_DN11730_c0_g1~~TRINITY_DN11730_c0_g1_i8.p2  ORF type:complete len:243 (-),score=-18.30 TRINITY_DN11730_c0_g1_i8:74-802(-)
MISPIIKRSITCKTTIEGQNPNYYIRFNITKSLYLFYLLLNQYNILQLLNYDIKKQIEIITLWVCYQLSFYPSTFFKSRITNLSYVQELPSQRKTFLEKLKENISVQLQTLHINFKITTPWETKKISSNFVSRSFLTYTIHSRGWLQPIWLQQNFSLNKAYLLIPIYSFEKRLKKISSQCVSVATNSTVSTMALLDHQNLYLLISNQSIKNKQKPFDPYKKQELNMVFFFQIYFKIQTKEYL